MISRAPSNPNYDVSNTERPPPEHPQPFLTTDRKLSAPVKSELLVAREQLYELEAQLRNIRNSVFWRATLPFRYMASYIPTRLRQRLLLGARTTYRLVTNRPPVPRQTAVTAPVFAQVPDYLSDAVSYAKWVVDCDTLSEEDRVRIRGHMEQFEVLPLISVLLPAFETSPALLREAIHSVKHQLYPNWELCIADDGTLSPHICEVLEQEAADDSRIRWNRRIGKNQISEVPNHALALAEGEFVALLQHNDRLAQHALYEVVALLNRYPDADIIFSDEDRIDNHGTRFFPYFKPDWDPELLLGQNCVGHLSVYRRLLLTEIGGFRPSLEGAQNYDLTLRASRRTHRSKIHHIPAILYHWRLLGGAKFSETQLHHCVAASRRAVEDHVAALPEGQGATVVPHPSAPNFHRVLWPLPQMLPKVSVLIPSRNRSELLGKCIEGLLNNTDYENLEIIIIDNGSDDVNCLNLLNKLTQNSRITVFEMDIPFNYSKLNNEAASKASGEFFIFMNNDVEIIEKYWLKEMISHCLRPNIGTVGARLLYEDGSIQHAGVALGVGNFKGGPGIAAHFFAGQDMDNHGYFQHSLLTRSVSASTAACIAIRRDLFFLVGGFDEVNLAIEYNDIDLCLRISELGRHHVWTPFAELLHKERASRGLDLSPQDAARSNQENLYMRQRWGSVLDQDPFYNPQFSRLQQNYELCIPARRISPWRNNLERKPSIVNQKGFPDAVAS